MGFLGNSLSAGSKGVKFVNVVNVLNRKELQLVVIDCLVCELIILP